MITDSHNNFNIVKLLVEKGAKIDIRCNDGTNAANIALIKGYTFIADYLNSVH